MPIEWLQEGSEYDQPHEMHGTAVVAFADDKLTADVQLKCPWADRYGILNTILLTPSEWPYLPDAGLYAVSGSIQPFTGTPGEFIDGSPSGLSYDEALLAVHFETLDIPESEGPGELYSESIEPTAEFLTIPHTKFRWGSGTGDALEPEEAPGRLEVGLDYVITWQKVATIPAAALSLIGCVNNSDVTSPSLGLTFGAGTLLFNPPKISRTVSLGGTNYFTMQIRLTYRRNGWNWFWRADKLPNPGWDQIYPEGTDTDPYLNFTPASFTGILP